MEYLILNSKSDPIETARAYVVLLHYLALFQMRNNMNQESRDYGQGHKLPVW